MRTTFLLSATLAAALAGMALAGCGTAVEGGGGNTMQSALQGENVYYPSSYRERLGGSSLQDNANVRVSVAVVGHFNAP